MTKARILDDEALRMRSGAVAMIDALGFMEISKRSEPTDVLRSLCEAQSKVERMRPLFDWLHGRSDEFSRRARDRGARARRFEVRFLSDTIVITASVDDLGPRPTMRDAVVGVATVVNFITAGAALYSTPPLNYRGCIAVGEFVAGRNFFVGPAINEAAEWMERADAAIVWLTPKAASCFKGPKTNVNYHDEPELVVDWTVPLKVGALRTLAVNPLNGSRTYGLDRPAALSTELLFERLLIPFGETPAIEVEIKRQHTESFLEHCRRIGRERDERRLAMQREIDDLNAEIRKGSD